MVGERADFQAVLKALSELDANSEAVRDMLVEGLPFAVAPCGGADQHKYVAEVQRITRDVLCDAQRSAADRATQCQAAVLGAQAKHKVLEAAVTAAFATEEAAKAEVARREAELRDATAAAEAEHGLYSMAKASKEAVASEAVVLEDLRCEAEAVRDGTLRVLLDGVWQDKSAMVDHVVAVQDYLRLIRAEPALVAAAPGALRRQPDSRAPFDGTTINAINRTIEVKLASLDADITAGKPLLKSASAEALGAWAIFDFARERATHAGAELERAQGLLSDASIARQAAEENVKNSWQAQSELLVAETLAGASVHSISTGLDALARLVASTNAPTGIPAAPEIDMKIQEMEVDAASLGA